MMGERAAGVAGHPAAMVSYQEREDGVEEECY